MSTSAVSKTQPSALQKFRESKPRCWGWFPRRFRFQNSPGPQKPTRCRMQHLHRDQSIVLGSIQEMPRFGGDPPTADENGVARDKKTRRGEDSRISRPLVGSCTVRSILSVDSFGARCSPALVPRCWRLPEDALAGTRIPRKSAPHFQREPNRPRDSQIYDGEIRRVSTGTA